MRESTLLHSRFQSQFKFLTLTLPCSPSNSCSCCQSKQVESKWSPVNPFLKAHCLQLFIYKDLNTICFLLPSLVFLLIISSLTVSIAESKRIFLSSVPFFGHSPTVFFPSSHLHLPLHCLGVLSWEKSFFTLQLDQGLSSLLLCNSVCPCPKALNTECWTDLAYLLSPHRVVIVKVSGKYVEKEVL